MMIVLYVLDAKQAILLAEMQIIIQYVLNVQMLKKIVMNVQLTLVQNV